MHARAPVPHAVARRLGLSACAEILRRYKAGETAQALAEEYGVARNAVLKLLRSGSVVVRRRSPTDGEKRRFVADYEKGATIAEIAKHTGFSFGSVQKALHSAHVLMRPRGGGQRSG